MENINVRSKFGEVVVGEKLPIKKKMRLTHVYCRFPTPITLGVLSGNRLCSEAIFEIASGKRLQRDGISADDFILLDDWVLEA